MAHVLVTSPITAWLASSLLALAPSAGTTPPSCRDLLEGIRAKLEANYAGYLLEVRGTARQADHDQVLAGLRRRADTTESARCFDVLHDYLAWFEDWHLFVYQNPRLDTLETMRRAADVPRHPVDPAAVRARLDRMGPRADPIEGIWYDGAMQVAVVPDPAGPAGRFLAVVTVSDTATLPVGAVHAVFVRQRHGGYTADLRWRSLAITHPPVTIHRGGTLLRLSPGMWGKRFPGPPAERALLDTMDVHRPTLTWRDRIAVLSIPSHDGGHRPRLEALLAQHRSRLDSATVLVLDLRGNEGGGSQTTEAVHPYVVGADPLAPSPDLGAPVMLSSPDQLSYVKRAFGSDTSAFVRRLVTAMEAAPGALVPLFDPSRPVPESVYPPPVFGPRQVLMLVDGGTVSAPEVLVQLALRSTRTVVVGEPTAGALDYQSTNVVRIHPQESRWFLGYPTITAHARLPEGGMRGTGLIPEVALSWGDVTDPVAAAVRALEMIGACLTCVR
jgi:hypothetical protein